MPVYSNRFKVEVIDGNAALSRQYTEIMATVSDAEAAAAAAAADAADAAASAEAAALAADFIFDSRADLADAVPSIANGQIVCVRGIHAIRDTSAIGSLSALNDLGVDGVRLLTGQVIPTSWWTAGVTGDASAQLIAANAHAAAVKAATGSPPITIKVDQDCSIANPVTLGGSGAYIVDTADARITLIDGGAFTANRNQWSVRVMGQGVTHRLGTIYCEHVAGGWAYEGCTKSIVQGPRAERFHWRGHYSIATNAGMTLDQPTGMEWGGFEQSTPGFSNSQYVSDGIYLDTNDVRVSYASIGFCLRPIVTASGAGGNELANCHPFNAKVPDAPDRSHTICIWNECPSRVFFYNTYLDCGYIVDTTATATIDGVWPYMELVSLSHPYIRISGDATPGASVRGGVEASQASVGLYTGSHTGDFTSVPNIQSNPPEMVGYGRRNEVSGKRVRLIASDDPEASDDFTSKRGSATAIITQTYAPGTGAQIQVQYRDGAMHVSRPATGNGEMMVSAAGATRYGMLSTGSALQFVSGGTTRLSLDSGSGVFRPTSDNSQNLGGPVSRWATVYAGTGAINTSDDREKQDVRDISEAERAVAVSLKALFRAYRFKDAVAIKGDAARIHFGVMAQEAAAAFEAEGLDPFRYGIICYDEWPDELDDDGNIVTPAGNRWGVRYDELLAFIVAAL